MNAKTFGQRTSKTGNMTEVTTVEAVASRDGAGVNISRIGGDQRQQLPDPFLILDEIRSDERDNYMAGFPPIPNAASRRLPTCSTVGCVIATTWGMTAPWCPAGVRWMIAGRGGWDRRLLSIIPMDN